MWNLALWARTRLPIWEVCLNDWQWNVSIRFQYSVTSIYTHYFHNQCYPFLSDSSSSTHSDPYEISTSLTVYSQDVLCCLLDSVPPHFGWVGTELFHDTVQIMVDFVCVTSYTVFCLSVCLSMYETIPWLFHVCVFSSSFLLFHCPSATFLSFYISSTASISKSIWRVWVPKWTEGTFLLLLRCCFK